MTFAAASRKGESSDTFRILEGVTLDTGGRMAACSGQESLQGDYEKAVGEPGCGGTHL